MDTHSDSNFTLVRLFQRLKEVEKRLSDKDEEIGAIDQGLRTVQDPVTEVKLNRQRDALKEEREGIEQEMQDTLLLISRNQQTLTLCALQSLYHQQLFDAFDQELNQTISAFVIEGAPPNELWWSAHFLLKQLRGTQGADVLHLLTIRPALTQYNDERGIWKALSDAYHLDAYSADPERVAGYVAGELQHQNVTLVVDALARPDDGDMEPPIDLDRLLTEFWPKLVEHVKAALEKQQQPAQTRLLLLVLHDEPLAGTVRVASSYDPMRQPAIPRQLGAIRHMTTGDVTGWLSSPALQWNLKRQLKGHEDDAIANSANGVPDRVMEYICAKANTTLDDEGARQWILR